MTPGVPQENVLVTGCAGYIGSILTEHLLDAGYRVTGMDSLAYGDHSLFHLAQARTSRSSTETRATNAFCNPL